MATQGKQAFLDATPMQKEVTLKHLTLVLAVLRAQYLSYQTSHWQVVSGTFYGNHLLFERLYKSVQDQVDQLAEKLVGYLGGEAVDLLPQMKHMLGCVIRWGAYSSHHKRGIASEAELQAVVQEAYDAIKVAGTMTLGLDDWLMATANQHEENTYLLQQSSPWRGGDPRLAALTPAAVHEVAPTAEGHFFDNPSHREVLEFADSNAISNIKDVTEEAAPELDISEAKALKETEKAPLTPVEIAKEPGGQELSTLNRLEIKGHEKRMAAWMSELLR